MKITLLQVGKTEEAYLNEGILAYEKRLKHYITFTTVVIPALKNTKALDEAQQKVLEGEAILRRIETSDHVCLLDEGGKTYSSVDFSNWIQQKMNQGTKNLVFVIGGPYGFSSQVYDRADVQLSLSALTFSHQMVRLFFTEQLYRAFTILKGEPYHHR